MFQIETRRENATKTKFKKLVAYTIAPGNTDASNINTGPGGNSNTRPGVGVDVDPPTLHSTTLINRSKREIESGNFTFSKAKVDR